MQIKQSIKNAINISYDNNNKNTSFLLLLNPLLKSYELLFEKVGGDGGLLLFTLLVQIKQSTRQCKTKIQAFPTVQTTDSS